MWGEKEGVSKNRVDSVPSLISRKIIYGNILKSECDFNDNTNAMDKIEEILIVDDMKIMWV